MQDNLFQIKNYAIKNIYHKANTITCSLLPDHENWQKEQENRRLFRVNRAMILQLLLSFDAVLLKFFSRLMFTPPYKPFELSVPRFLLTTPSNTLLGSFTVTSAGMSLQFGFEPLMCFLACFSSPMYGGSLARLRWILSHHRQVLLDLFLSLLKTKISPLIS